MTLIDTHCHLTSAGLIERLDEVLAAARAAGVARMITVAVNVADTHVALELLDTHPELCLAVGLHPHEADHWTPQDFDLLVGVLRGDGVAAHCRDRIVAIGETGLDFHYDFSPPERQEAVFRAHLDTAVRLQKPVIIHARESETRVLEILKGYPALAGRVVFHCFSADRDVARAALDLGCYLSFTGIVTFKGARTVAEAARFAPADRLMVETDAPYLSPEPVRKTRPNEPAHVVHTARFLAELRGETLEALAATTTANATRFFGLPQES